MKFGLNVLRDLKNGEEQELLKFVFLSFMFFFLIAGHTVTKELKDSVFISIVGKAYIPWAKFLAMFVLIPAIFLYSRIVDGVRRYQLLALCGLFFGLLGLILSYLLGHPTIGLANTNASSSRIFGWIFYCFIEGQTPFLVNVFWAFAHSITSPEGAKRGYPYMISASKLGGMLSSACAWYLFSMHGSCAVGSCADVRIHQFVLAGSACLILSIPFFVYLLMKKVPGRYLHGYEAAYRAEKEKSKLGTDKTGIWAGLIMLLKYPYVLGIFGMLYFYEVISTVLGYLRLGVVQEHSANLSQVSAYLFEMIFFVHAVGFIISFFGTSALMQRLGQRKCLMLIPVLSGVLLVYLMVETTPMVLIGAWVVLKAVNYAFAWPVRESLYIPTVKSIKFKSKAWIDAFGSKIAKSSGSTFNLMMAKFEALSFSVPVYSAFFATIISVWFIVALSLGRRFDKAVARNEVIGLEADGKGS